MRRCRRRSSRAPSRQRFDHARMVREAQVVVAAEGQHSRAAAGRRTARRAGDSAVRRCRRRLARRAHAVGGSGGRSASGCSGFSTASSVACTRSREPGRQLVVAAHTGGIRYTVRPIGRISSSRSAAGEMKAFGKARRRAALRARRRPRSCRAGGSARMRGSCCSGASAARQRGGALAGCAGSTSSSSKRSSIASAARQASALPVYECECRKPRATSSS